MPSQLGACAAFESEGSDSVGRDPALLELLAGAGGAGACATGAGEEKEAWPATGLVALTELDRPAAT
jgi:hypothetical protein